MESNSAGGGTKIIDLGLGDPGWNLYSLPLLAVQFVELRAYYLVYKMEYNTFHRVIVKINKIIIISVRQMLSSL